MRPIEHLTPAPSRRWLIVPASPMALDRSAASSADTERDGGSVMNTNTRWPLERVLFALAGTVTLLSAVLAVAVSEWFVLLTAFGGVNQWLYVLVGACPASIVLRRSCGLRSAVYDNGATTHVSETAVRI